MKGDVVRKAAQARCGTGDAGLSLPSTAAAEVSVAVNTWVEQVGQFLAVLQAALEETRPKDDASAEVRALVRQLPAILRECRAQVPTPEMIRTWVRSVSESEQAGAPQYLASGAA